MEDAHIEFQSNIHRTIKTKAWAKIFIGIFVLISIVTIFTIVFASRICLKRICCLINCQKKIDYLFHLCLKKKQCQVDDSSFNMHVHNSMPVQNDICYDVMYQNKKNIDQFQPLLNKVVCDNLIQHPLPLNYSMKEISVLNSNVAFDCLPLTARISTPIDSSNILSPKIIHQKPNPVPRKIYDYMRVF